MTDVAQLLGLAGIRHETYSQAQPELVYLTLGNQLIGTYKSLRKFCSACSDYHGWQAHHVVETQDLDRLNIASAAPARDAQLCVLLPERAHIGRINSVLRRQAPIGSMATPRELVAAYKEAYALMGDYCGGGELLIQRELVGIVRATFRSFQLL